MKKKKLLCTVFMAALAFVTTNTFVSCKDYDDDISDLRGEIEKLATKDELTNKVNELQGLISTNQTSITGLQGDLAALKTTVDGKATLDQVQTLLADYATKKSVEDADQTLQAAIEALQTKDIAELKSLVEAAQKAADDAAEDAKAKYESLKSDLNATQAGLAAAEKQAAHADSLAAENKKALDNALALLGSGFDETNTVKAALEAISGQVGTQASTLSDLGSRLAVVEQVLKDADDDTSTGLASKITDIENDLKDIIGEYTTMVTNVDLYVSKYQDAYRNNVPDNNLQFIFVPQEKTVKFPLNDKVADAQIEFSADNKNVTTTDSLVIRVSPTNAVLSPSNISLITSQGKELSDYVEVKSVNRYNTLITSPQTRATDNGNGLWVVTFGVKEGVEPAKLAEEVAVKRGNYNYAIEFAVAVKNTASADTRRVISAYDVEVKPSDYEPALDDVLVENRDGAWYNIDEIHNRFYYTDEKNYGALANETSQVKEKKDVTEYKWENITEPQIEGTTTGREIAKCRTNDVRSSIKKLVEVSVGQDININVASLLVNGMPDINGIPDRNGSEGGVSSASDARGRAVKGFYVTLDKEFAIESSPSEWNAWKKYKYTNVGINSGDDYAKEAKLFYGNRGYISIDDEDALGDVIGFRVYVVNLDGTLVDPDGRAFYVQVGEPKGDAELLTSTASVNLRNLKDGKFDGVYGGYFDNRNVKFLSDTLEISEDIFAGTDYEDLNDGTVLGYKNADGSVSKGAWHVTVNPSAYGNNHVDPVYGEMGDYVITYFDKNKNITTVIEDIKYAQIQILNPTNFLDNGTYTVTTTLFNSNEVEVRDIKLSFTKTMPTASNIRPLAWVTGYDPTKQVFTNVDWASANIYKISAGANVEAVKLADKIDNLGYGATNGGWYTLEFQGIESMKDAEKDPYVIKIEGGYASDLNNLYKLQVKRQDIDTKSHDINYKYNFGDISLVYNWETAQYERPGKYVVDASNKLAMTFNSWVDFENIKWKATPTLRYVAGGNVADPQYVYIADYTKQANTPQTVNATDTNGNVCYYYKTTAGVEIYVVEKVVEDTPATEGYYDADGKWVDGTAATYSRTLYTCNYDKDTHEVSNVSTTAWTATEKYSVYKQNVTYQETVQTPQSVTAKNAIVAWNTVLRNYPDLTNASIFGAAGKEVELASLLGTYMNVNPRGTLDSAISVSFEPASLFDVEYSVKDADDNGNGVLTFTQKTFSANPVNKGTLTIKSRDCFGHEWEKTLDITIEQ